MRVLDRAYLRDALIASDPDLGRLRLAARTTLAAITATAVLTTLIPTTPKDKGIALIGIAMATMGSAVVNDPLPRDQRITMALVPLVASATLLAAALVSPLAWLRTAFLLATIFCAVLVRRFGPRGTALGTIAFFACFFTLFFGAGMAQAPMMIAGIFVASALAYVVRFWILRERLEVSLRLRVDALRRSIALVLFRLVHAAAEGRFTTRRRHAVQRRLGAVNELALAIEEPGERVGAGALARGVSALELRARIFDLELAIARVASAVARLDGAKELSPQARAAVAEALSAARQAVRTGDEVAAQSASRALEAVGAHVDREADSTHPLVHVRAAIEDLLEAARWTFHFTPAAPPAEGEAPRLSGAPPVAAPSTLRLAAQATVAAALALAAGQAISTSRAYWAVLTAFVVFIRANTLGATLVRAWQRVLGTVVGVILGLFVAHAIQGRTYVELGVAFTCMFVAYYTLQVAYTWMVASFTTLLAALYSLLGLFSPHLLYLRVLETLVGAGIGAGTAALLFPATARERLRLSMVGALGMLGEYLDVTLVQRGARRAALLGAARALDRRLRDIRGEVQLAAGSSPLRPPAPIARIFLALSAVFFCARPLAAAAWPAPEDPAEPHVRAAGQELAHNARALADALTARKGQEIAPAAPHIEAALRALTAPEAHARGAGSPVAVLHWLRRLDEALLELSRVSREAGLVKP